MHLLGGPCDRWIVLQKRKNLGGTAYNDTTKSHKSVKSAEGALARKFGFFGGRILVQTDLIALTEAGAVVRTPNADPAFGDLAYFGIRKRGPSPPRRYGPSGGMSTSMVPGAGLTFSALKNTR